MKLIRIGNSPTCDIQLTSSYVSSTHAEITLLDGGEIILEDLGSTNGTYVNGTRIKANQEVSIRRGDRIRFADTELVWSRIPSLSSNLAYTRIVNIGTNYRNDLQINSGAVSRFHATLKIDKKGKVFIVDNGSRNGTKVNGVKISKETPVQIKRGYNVILANEDITENLQQYFRSNSNILRTLLFSLCGIAAVIAAIIIFPHIYPKPANENAVAHVRAQYHYEITLSDTPIELDGLTFRYPETGEITYEGTAFFIDKLGHLATNRHITHPWDYRDKNVDDEIKKYVGGILKYVFETSEIKTESELERFMENPIGEVLCNYVIKKYPENQRLIQLNVLLNRIHKSGLNIKGIHDNIAIGFAGRMYDKHNYSEYAPCTVVADSKDKEIDIAIIRMNTMHTPENIKTVFDVNKIHTEKLVPQKDELVCIGYPNGSIKAHATTITLQPTIIETKCSKNAEKYNFECQAISAGGASGSPLFFKNTNKVVGVLSNRWTTTDGGIVCVQGRYLKELYDKECR